MGRPSPGQRRRDGPSRQLQDRAPLKAITKQAVQPQFELKWPDQLAFQFTRLG